MEQYLQTNEIPDVIFISVKGYALDEFFRGKLNLIQSRNNTIGIIFDKALPKPVLNVHINTINAVKTVYGTNVCGYEITDKGVGVDFFIDKSHNSTILYYTIVDSFSQLSLFVQISVTTSSFFMKYPLVYMT